MLRAHKIRLNPTPEQATYFRKATGTARFVYNWGLKEIICALDDGRTPESAFELKVRFNAIKREQFPDATECHNLDDALRALEAASERYDNGRS